MQGGISIEKIDPCISYYHSVTTPTSPTHENENSGSNTDTRGKVDLNTATEEQLRLLPGIGQVLAQRILDYRKQNGSFTVVEDLLKVEGIGKKKFEEIRLHVYVGG